MPDPVKVDRAIGPCVGDAKHWNRSLHWEVIDSRGSKRRPGPRDSDLAKPSGGRHLQQPVMSETSKCATGSPPLSANCRNVAFDRPDEVGENLLLVDRWEVELLVSQVTP